MPDPISSGQIRPLGPIQLPGAATPTKGKPAGDEFATMLRGQLEQVSRMQAEADRSVQSLLTGETQSITEVFTTARKADVAFSLLMEIRNKLITAYDELKTLRV